MQQIVKIFTGDADMFLTRRHREHVRQVLLGGAVLLFVWWLVGGLLPSRPRRPQHVPSDHGHPDILRKNNLGRRPSRSGLSTKYGKFYMNGERFTILSGAVHYFRVHPELWKDRLLKLKAAGLNTVETYVAWNLHEEVKENWNFEGWLDLRKYLQIAKDLGLYVILRPGPYICSEWEFGGFPSWLLHDPNMKVRTNYEPFIEAADLYFSNLMRQVEPMQYTNGGPIIAFQVENEYGNYGKDYTYMEAIQALMIKHGVKEMMFTSDGVHGIQNGYIPKAIMSVNFKKEEKGRVAMAAVHKIRPSNPLMVMEFWTGWFDHWGLEHHTWGVSEFRKVLKFILTEGSSVNFYMFHGGTNFGFMSGANAAEDGTIKPTTTSYDYDAPLSESGDRTLKYHAVKEILKQYAPRGSVPAKLPEEPPDSPKYKYGTVYIKNMMSLEEMLNPIEAIEYGEPVWMEYLGINNGGGQSYGFILYRHHITTNGMLKLPGLVRDRAVILLNGVEQVVLGRHDKRLEHEIKGIEKEAVLDILVENMGRVNYGSGQLDSQRKGLNGRVTLNGETLGRWKIYPIEFKTGYVKIMSGEGNWQPFKAQEQNKPQLYQGFLQISGTPQDTFLNMEGWKKGVVFINSFNLGRYWEIGPQKTLYVPAPLLRTGKNSIMIFELHQPDEEVVFLDKPDLLGGRPPIQ